MTIALPLTLLASFCPSYSSLLSPDALRTTQTDVRLLSAEVMKPAFTELSGGFEQLTGRKLTILYDSAGKVTTRLQAGEHTDAVIIQQPVAVALADQGLIMRDSIVTLAQSGVGLAIRKGAPKPDISSVAAVKRTLLAAKSIAYPDPGRGAASGIHFRNVIEHLGIAREINAKAKLMKGTLGEFASEGEAEIAITQPMEILATPDYDLVGWLPDELQNYKSFTWAVASTTNGGKTEAVQALIRYLASPSAAQIMEKKGMKPIAK